MGIWREIGYEAGMFLMELMEAIGLFIIAVILLIPAILAVALIVAVRVIVTVWEFGERRTDDACLKMIGRLKREEQRRNERR